MALVVEDGTGKSNANSFVDDAYFRAWAKVRGRADLIPQSGTEREPFLVLAADYIANEKRFTWRGVRKTAEQSMPWPRTGVVDADGLSWSSAAVPWRVMMAQCELAWLNMTGVDLQPALSRGGQIISETVGPISTTYANAAPAETEFPAAVGVLEPLLWRSKASKMIPYLTTEVTVSGFEGEFMPEDDGA